MNFIQVLLQALFRFPGTFLHELAHLLVGLVLNAKPVNVSLFPRKEGDKIILGSVGFRNVTWYNAFPTAMAPFLLIIPIYILSIDLNIMEFNKVLNSIFALDYIVIVKLYLLYTFILAIIPSPTDFKVAFSNIFGLLFYTAVIVLTLSYYNIIDLQPYIGMDVNSYIKGNSN